MSHSGPRGRGCDSSSEKAPCIKQITKSGEITNFTAIVSSGTIYFSSHKSREEFNLGVRNTV